MVVDHSFTFVCESASALARFIVHKRKAAGEFFGFCDVDVYVTGDFIRCSDGSGMRVTNRRVAGSGYSRIAFTEDGRRVEYTPVGHSFICTVNISTETPISQKEG